MCDGTAYPTNEYPNLFAVLGSACGASGTTFNVPDCRGIFLRGVNGTRNDAYADPDTSSTYRAAINPGGNTGNAVGTYQQDMFRSHTHGINNLPNISFYVGSGGTGFQNAGDYDGPNQTMSIAPAGGDETRPKNIYVNYIIKY